MTEAELEALPMDKQVAYWKSRMLVAIGEGKMDSELYFLIDYQTRMGFRRGVESMNREN